MALIGICGKRGSGKDTLALRLVERRGFTQFAFASPLKEAIRALFGFDVEKDKIDPLWGISPRSALQVLGTDLIRNQLGELLGLTENVFITRMRHHLLQERGPVVISDVRFPDEVSLVKEMGGIIIKVVRPGIPGDDHESETSLDDVSPDILLENDSSLEDFLRKIDSLSLG